MKWDKSVTLFFTSMDLFQAASVVPTEDVHWFEFAYCLIKIHLSEPDNLLHFMVCVFN